MMSFETFIGASSTPSVRNWKRIAMKMSATNIAYFWTKPATDALFKSGEPLRLSAVI